MKPCHVIIINGNEPKISSVELLQVEKAALLNELTSSFSYSKDLVYVLTPGGDVESLPIGSTPIDFAYRIHTDIGNHCSQARVNGQKVPLNTPLKNGDTVEIITLKNSHPKEEWLREPKAPVSEHPFIKTRSARSKIMQWFKKKSYEESISRGQELLGRIIGKINLETLQKSQLLIAVAKELNYPQVEGLLAAIGYGAISLQQVSNRLGDIKYRWGRNLLIKELGQPYLENLERLDVSEEISAQHHYYKFKKFLTNFGSYSNFKNFLIDLGGEIILLNTSSIQKLKDIAIDFEEVLEKEQSYTKTTPSNSPYLGAELINEKYIKWIVGGEDNILYRFASCCTVHPCGENIGVARHAGSGLVIHNKECRNLKKISKEQLIEVTNAIEVEIKTKDRVGVERDVANWFVEQNLNIRAGTVKTYSNKENKEAVFFKSVTVSNPSEIKALQYTISKLQQMKDVLQVKFHE
jgi:(p)ppGpp synthase/HD superfamily hydrolase